MTTITAILGGEKELGQKVKKPTDFDALIKKGMPAGVIGHIKSEFRLPDEVIARIIGISPRTVARRRKTAAQATGEAVPAARERLSPVESDRIYRFARIVARAEEVFESKGRSPRVVERQTGRSRWRRAHRYAPDRRRHPGSGRASDSHRLRSHFLKKAWRIVRERRLADAFTGEGARLGGGRWNYPGTSVVYVSESLSLAILELFIHFTRKDMAITASLRAIPVEISEDVTIEEVLVGDLKPDWRSSPPPDSTRNLGAQWMKKGASAVLCVPSVIVPEECNLVINPAHADFGRLKIGKPQKFSLDGRMWK